MAPKRKGSRLSHNMIEANLNVTPVMNLFVVLIPFLLFSAVFLKLALINVALPGLAGEDTVNRAAKDSGPQVQITVGISNERLILSLSGDINVTEEIIVKDDTFKEEIVSAQNSEAKKKMVAAALDRAVNKLHGLLVTVKERYPKKSDIIVIPDSTARYELIVKVFDTARELYKEDPDIVVTDPLGMKVKLRKLFPNVVLGSI